MYKRYIGTIIDISSFVDSCFIFCLLPSQGSQREYRTRRPRYFATQGRLSLGWRSTNALTLRACRKRPWILSCHCILGTRYRPGKESRGIDKMAKRNDIRLSCHCISGTQYRPEKDSQGRGGEAHELFGECPRFWSGIHCSDWSISINKSMSDIRYHPARRECH